MSILTIIFGLLVIVIAFICNNRFINEGLVRLIINIVLIIITIWVVLTIFGIHIGRV